MNPRLILLFLLFSARVCVWPQSFFSRPAKPIWKRLAIPAPDGKKSVVVRNVEGFPAILIRAGSHVYYPQTPLLINAEAAWAPDSKAFFVTYSDAGNVGRYHVLVIYVSDVGIKVIEVDRQRA